MKRKKRCSVSNRRQRESLRSYFRAIASGVSRLLPFLAPALIGVLLLCYPSVSADMPKNNIKLVAVCIVSWGVLGSLLDIHNRTTCRSALQSTSIVGGALALAGLVYLCHGLFVMALCALPVGLLCLTLPYCLHKKIYG